RWTPSSQGATPAKVAALSSQPWRPRTGIPSSGPQARAAISRSPIAMVSSVGGVVGAMSPPVGSIAWRHRDDRAPRPEMDAVEGEHARLVDVEQGREALVVKALPAGSARVDPERPLHAAHNGDVDVADHEDVGPLGADQVAGGLLGALGGAGDV